MYYIEKVEPMVIIRRSEIEINSFLEHSIRKYLFLWNDLDSRTLLFKDISFKIDVSLHADIDLINLDILTSRLAVVIYRVAKLNLYASVTEAGEILS